MLGSDVFGMLEQSNLCGIDFRQLCMDTLYDLDGYDWCGVYKLVGDELVLDAYVGAPTEHDRIPVGSGVCGTAVATGQNQVVEDVGALENYLSCSLETKAEIVVLIRAGDEVLGQIDIDSHQRGRFKERDELMLERMALLIADRWA